VLRQYHTLLFDSFSNNQSRKANHLGVVLVEELLDGNITKFDVVLGNKAFFL